MTEVLCVEPDTGLARRENNRDLRPSRGPTDTKELEDYQSFLAGALNKCKKMTLYNRLTSNSANKQTVCSSSG